MVIMNINLNLLKADMLVMKNYLPILILIILKIFVGSIRFQITIK